MSIIKTGAYFTSNYGCGPLHARIIGVDGDTVRMKRWLGRSEYRKGKNVSYFELPAKFFFSPSCGWRADDKHS